MKSLYFLLLIVILSTTSTISTKSKIKNKHNFTGEFHIVGKNSHKCINIDGANKKNGANVIQYPCTDNDNDHFTFTPLGDDTYIIIAKHSGKSLDTEMGAMINGGNIVQESLSSSKNQQWEIKLAPGEKEDYFIKNKKSNKCISVHGNSKKNLANIELWECIPNDNVKFKFVPIIDLKQGVYHIIAKHSKKCVNIYGGSKKDGANVIQWPCTDSANDHFLITSAVGNNVFITAKHSGKTLDVEGGNTSDGGNVIQWKMHKGDNQQWELKPVPGEELYYQIINKKSKKCLSVHKESKKNGENIEQWECANKDHFKFKIRSAQVPKKKKPNFNGGVFHIVAKHSKKCINIYGGSKKNGANAEQWPCSHNLLFDHFIVKSAGFGFFFIIAKHSKKSLDIKEGSKDNGGNLIQWPLHKGVNQQWKIQMAPSQSEYYQVINRNSGKCLSVHGASKKDGGNVEQWQCVAQDNVLFKFVEIK